MAVVNTAAGSSTPVSSHEASRASVGEAGRRALILMRLGVGPASRVDIARDLKEIVAASVAQLKQAIEGDARDLLDAGFVRRAGARLETTEAGRAAAARVAGVTVEAIDAVNWQVLRDGPLTLAALGADAGDVKLVKAIQSPDALRAVVVQSAFGFDVDKPMSLGKLRALLALRALERAFGGQIKAALGNGSALAAKPSRLLAAQLARKPKEFGSDGKLVAALAAEHLGVANAEPDTLRTALLKRWAATLPPIGADRSSAVAQTPLATVPARRSSAAAILPATNAHAASAPANDRGAVFEAASTAQSRPDLPGFVRAVAAAAAKRAEGWPGNRKAFICHVYDEVTAAQPRWGLSDIEFKGMLAEAHRTGGLVLANADLKDKRFMQEFEKSAIQYKNTVWHFVRVEES